MNPFRPAAIGAAVCLWPAAGVAAPLQSDGGTYALAIAPAPEQIPLNDYFEFVVAVTHAASGTPVGSAVALRVDAVMPAHGHGMFTDPEITPEGGGRFVVDGMLLHMPGRWELRFDLTRDGVTERALVELDLDATDEASDTPIQFTDIEKRRMLQLSPLPAPPEDTSGVADDARAAALGQRLFFDTRLSGNGELSCASCHDPELGFADGRPLAAGVAGGTRHTPALWNVAYNRWYFWDGRADSLWSQALKPMESTAELGSDRLAIAHVVAGDPALRARYEAIFGRMPPLQDRSRFPEHARPIPGASTHPHEVAWRRMSEADRDAVTGVFVNVAKSIAAYERRLLSIRSPFDEFVEGVRSGDRNKLSALTPAARRGLRVFLGQGQCRLCHLGPNLTDGEFHSVHVPPLRGIPRDPGRFGGVALLRGSPFNAAGAFSDRPDGEAARRLRFLASGPELWGAFKTPTLRNVALTAPYMHQGQLATLGDVVEYYSTLEGAVPPHHHAETILQPRRFSEQEKADLVAFLESLTDTGIDPALLAAPGD